MRLKLISGLVIGLILVVSMSTFAASTAEQQLTVQDAKAKVVEAQKELIAAQVKAGILTQEQADRIIAWIDARLKTTPVISEEQKQALAEAYQKRVAALKDLINAQVKAGRITPERGEYLIKILEARAEYQEATGFTQRQPGKVNRRQGLSGRGFGLQYGQPRRIMVRSGKPIELPNRILSVFGIGRASLPRLGIIQQFPGIRQKLAEEKDTKDSKEDTKAPTVKRQFIPGIPFGGAFKFGIQAIPSVPSKQK